MLKRRSSAHVPLRISLEQAITTNNNTNSRNSRSKIPRATSGPRAVSSELKRQPSFDKIERQSSTLGKRSRSTLGIRETPIQFSKLNTVQKGSSVKSSNSSKDTRPVNDKKWLETQLAKVHNFLSGMGGEGTDILMNNNGLRPLTAKAFVEVSNILIKCIDSKLSITQANYIEELPIILRMFRYATPIKKSFLISVNIPRNWPTALCIMSWLVELVQGFNHFEPDLNTVTSDVTTRVYSHWLNGVALETFNDEIRTLILQKEDVSLEGIQTKYGIVQELNEELEDKNQRIVELNRTKKSFEMSELQIQSIKESISKSEETKQQLLKRIKNLKDKMKSQEKTVQTMVTEKETLETLVKQQTVTAEMRTAKIEECALLEQQIKSTNSLIEHVNDCIYGEELKMMKYRDNVAAFSDEYNKKCLSNTTELNAFAIYDLILVNSESLNILSDIQDKMEKFFREKRRKIKEIDAEIATLSAELKKFNEKYKYYELEETEKIPALKEKIKMIVNDLEQANKEIKSIKESNTKLKKEIEVGNDWLKKIQDQQHLIIVQSETALKKIEDHNASIKAEFENIVQKTIDHLKQENEETWPQLTELVKKMKGNSIL